MVNIFGNSKKDDDPNGNNADAPRPSEDDSRASPSHRYDSREPDERTRLLPQQRRPRPHQDGYLDPDDPAVSPYNLWSVRFTRYLTVLFLVITFLWWVLLLVCIFVSPPGMHSRGSGFFDFSYTTLTAGNLLVALLFFAAPSRAMRVSTGIVAALLLVDMILILAVPRLRAEEGGVGIASVVWAVVLAVWCVLADRVVAWGKREEEERLTGRPETRRTLREWLAVLVATAILVIYILIALLLTGTLVLRSLDAGLAPPGQRYPVDGHKYEVHLSCVGNTTTATEPTVLLEAGENPAEQSFEHWAYAAWQNGTIARYCYWDRPGYGWSDNAPSPHSAGMSADALSEALARAGEDGPWVLVSAGYGSVVSRVFASRQRGVRGMMLVDGLHEDLLAPRLGNPARGFATWGWGVLSPLGVTRIGGALFQGRTREDRVYGREARKGGKFLKARLQENLVAESFSLREVSQSRKIQSRKTPVVVVSSGIRCRVDDEWNRKQEDLTHLTDRLVAWDVVGRAPHEVWQTLEGRKVMERRLRELVKAAEKE
ncbi:MAG: hypothetical protein M1821_008602 [Bathelium mastoideum]|nr:MAG: hypothetical protein M1821_008602 [Bathelium mastoideum]